MTKRDSNDVKLGLRIGSKCHQQLSNNSGSAILFHTQNGGNACVFRKGTQIHTQIQHIH